MSEYRVKLDNFSGPLDLLLYLVRKEEVDVYDIPICRVTEEYIRHIEMVKLLDIELAGEFLVMAATLMEIKSAMLLPKDQVDALDDEDASDPRMELIRQLLEYKKFKDSANLLKLSAQNQQQKFPRSDNIIAALKSDNEPEFDIDQINVWDLLGAFDNLMQATGNLMDISHITDDTPIDLYQIEVLHRLQTEGPLSFERLFKGKKNRLVMVGIFLSILELVRDKLVTAEQAKPDMAIYLRALTEEPAESAVKKAILSSSEELNEAEEEKNPIPIETIEPAESGGPAVSIKAIETSKRIESPEKSQPATLPTDSAKEAN